MNHPGVRYWLLAALLCAFLPQLVRLPGWLDGLLLAALLWRLPPVEQRLPLPGKAVMVLLLFGGMALINQTYQTLFGPEAGTAFLIFCVALKLLETRDERAHYVLLTLAFFVLATAFLFSQSLLITVYAAAAVLVITGAYISLNQAQPPRRVLVKAGMILAQALPLMLILFVFFPRLPPLWTLKMTEGSGHTGMSDTMSPGDIAKLSQSGELAFRVEFPDHRVPAKATMYWRGLTLSRFDGQTWRPSENHWLADYGMTSWGSQLPEWVENQIILRDTKPLKYRIILEPTDNTWLYGLDFAYSREPGVGLTRDFRLVSNTPVYQRLTYSVEKYVPLALDPDLPDWLRQDNLSLPAQGNPQARRMAREWRGYYLDDRRYIDAVLAWYRSSPFFYTLEPPALGANRIDEFLFGTRRGFCEHYASSFTFLLRAAGIPARVILGYQGGEPSPTGDSWQVRQMDAHAWVEAWLPKQGWIRLDPTAAVAPERIEHGMGELAQNQALWGDTALSVVKYGNYKLWGRFRNMADYLNYRWQRDVIGYDTESQEAFLLRLLGDSQLWKRVAVMFGALVAVAGLLAVWTILRGRRVVHPADRVILRLSARLARRGLARHPGEGVIAYLDRLEQLQPHWRPQLQALRAGYSRVRYEPGAVTNSRDIRVLAGLLRRWPGYQPQPTRPR